MRLTQFLQISAVALITLVAADGHSSCTCHNQDSYNWRITTKACDDYNANTAPVTYDSPSGRCNTNDGSDSLDGDGWETTCQNAAKEGFTCGDGVGTCYVSDTSMVQGWCE